MNRHTRTSSRRGTALVEMALVLPIFLMVVLGIIEFGRALMVSQLVTNSAREGARSAMLDGSTNAEVTQDIKTFLQDACNVSQDQVTVTVTVTPATGNPDPGNQVANASPRDLINILVQVPFDQVALLSGDYLAGKNLVGEASMRHE